MALKEDYLDDILDTSVNEKRKYRMINNADGTISLEDVTEYSQNGNNFGASDINITNKTVNELIAMGLNVRCNSEGYLEVKVDGIWEQSDLKAIEQNEVFLYNKGQELIEWDKTLEGISWGGAIPSTLKSATFNEDNIYFETTTQNEIICTISKEPVDLANYSILRISAKVTKQTNNFGLNLLIVQNKSVITQDIVANKQMYTITDDYIEYEFDISSLSGSYYLYLTTTETTGRAGYVNAISLVK